MSDNKKDKSTYSKSVRIACIVLAALTVLGVATTILYYLFA